MADQELSRRDFLKMAGVVLVGALELLLLSGCTPEQARLILAHPDIPWGSLSFKSELLVRSMEISWETFLETSDRYKIPRKNMRGIDIVIANKTLPEFPNYFNDAQHVVATVSENNQGYIEIAGSIIIKDARAQESQRPLSNGDQSWTKDLPSNLMSHAVFLGYSMVGVQRGLLKSEFLEETPLQYYNDMADSSVKPFIEMELKPLAGTLNI